MALTTTQLREIELATIRPQQGGRISVYNPTASGVSTELRWEPNRHGNIALWNGVTWVVVNPPYLSTTTSVLDTTGQSLVANANYDVFVKYQTATSGSLEFSRWYGNNSRLNNPVRYEGIYVYNDTDAGKKMRFVGTIRLTTISGINYFTNTVTQRFTVNWDNQIISAVKAYQTGTTWVVNVGGRYLIESWGGAGLVRGEFLCINNNNNMPGGVQVGQTTGQVENWSYVGMYLSSTVYPVGPTAQWYQRNQAAQADQTAFGYPYFKLGYNYLSIGVGDVQSMSFDAMTGSDYRTAGSLMIYT